MDVDEKSAPSEKVRRSNEEGGEEVQVISDQPRRGEVGSWTETSTG